MSDAMNAAAEMLRERFDGKDVLQFVKAWRGKDGRDHSMTFDYIEDETVMDRLDEVLGLGASSFDFEVVSDVCVKGTLVIRWPSGDSSHYQDFGYATRPDSAEPLKEAVSDAIRRLGRYVGVARYLYHKHDSGPAPRQPVQNAPQRTQAPEPTTDPYADLPNDWETPGYSKAPAPSAEEDACPEHNLRWTLKPAGVSKANKPYDAFWKCDGKTDGEFCKAKPSKAWQARHEG